MVEKNELINVKDSLPSENWKEERALVKELTAKNCTDTEFKLLWHLAESYGLNPLKKEVYAIKYQGRPAIIMVSHAGLINIAHRSGKFGAMETVCEMEPDDGKPVPMGYAKKRKPISATCIVYRNDFDKPFKSTVYFDEFDRGMALWESHPKAMLIKCAEATALRRAFHVSGLYIQEEMDMEININGKAKN